MRSLFARIWFSYWLMVALTLAAALAISYGLAVKRTQDASGISPAAFAKSAGTELARNGRDGLAMWVMTQRHLHPELDFYFVDSSGHEILGRPIGGQVLPGRSGSIVPTISTSASPGFRLFVRRTGKFSFGAWQLFFQPFLLIGLAIGVTGAGSAMLAYQLSRPIARLRSDVRTVAAGEIQTSMSPWITRRRDEVGGLARDIDQMTTHLRSLIESKQDLLRDISHELRSPLARLRVATSLLRDERPSERAGAFRRIDREVERLDGLIGRILEFSRVQGGAPPVLELIELVAIVDEVVEDARIEADLSGKRIVFAPPSPIHIRADRALIASAVENVLRNAVRFGPVNAPVEVRTGIFGRFARVIVLDSGPGIRPDLLPRICEPFFRAQDSSGVGLGLSIAERIAVLHGGGLDVHNRPSGGLAVELFFVAEQADESSGDVGEDGQ